MDKDELTAIVNPRALVRRLRALPYEELRAIIEVSHVVHFWGQDEVITPRLARKVFGNGCLLIALYPLLQRPNYFAVRVDSSWWTRRDGDEELQEHLVDIYHALEDQFGPPCYEGDEYYETEADSQFPYIDWGEGSCWSVLFWPGELEATQAYWIRKRESRAGAA